MSIVQVAVRHFALGNHMKLPGKFGMGGEGRCRTVHYWSQHNAKNISGVHSFLRVRIVNAQQKKKGARKAKGA